MNLLSKTSQRPSGKSSLLNRRVIAMAVVAVASWVLAGAAVVRLLGWHIPIGPGP